MKKEKDFLISTLGSEKRLYYKIFWQYSKENFSLGFGQPVKDACITCEELNLKTKSPFLGESAKRVAFAELLVHKRRAKKFYTSLKDVTEKCVNEPNIIEDVGVCIDYMAYVSLPCIPVQDMYYFRQLTVNVFGIHNLGTRQMTVFIYHEGEGGKGSNKVCTKLNWYINNKIDKDVETLFLFVDNCAGQNKNNSLVRMMMGFCKVKRFKNVKVIFPI